MEVFLGEVILVAFNFTPNGYQNCSGQLLSITQNTALFALVGTIYGGDGTTTFALPDLRGRVPINQGQGPGLPSYTVGQVGGANLVTITANQMPQHNHSLNADQGLAGTALPSGNYLAAGPVLGSGPNATLLNTYTTTAPNASLGASSIGF